MNRDELKAKAKAFLGNWADNMGDFWAYHAATGTLSIIAYIALKFLAS